MSESTTSTGISNPRLPNITSWAALKIRKTIDTKIALC
jgi:hypothetical protein